MHRNSDICGDSTLFDFKLTHEREVNKITTRPCSPPNWRITAARALYEYWIPECAQPLPIRGHAHTFNTSSLKFLIFRFTRFADNLPCAALLKEYEIAAI